jgi:hypothetical protein
MLAPVFIRTRVIGHFSRLQAIPIAWGFRRSDGEVAYHQQLPWDWPQLQLARGYADLFEPLRARPNQGLVNLNQRARTQKS